MKVPWLSVSVVVWRVCKNLQDQVPKQHARVHNPLCQGRGSGQFECFHASHVPVSAQLQDDGELGCQPARTPAESSSRRRFLPGATNCKPYKP